MEPFLITCYEDTYHLENFQINDVDLTGLWCHYYLQNDVILQFMQFLATEIALKCLETCKIRIKYEYQHVLTVFQFKVKQTSFGKSYLSEEFYFM